MKPAVTVIIREPKRSEKYITMDVSDYIQFIREQAKIIGVDMGISKDKTAISHYDDNNIKPHIITDIICFEEAMGKIKDLMENNDLGTLY